MYLIGYSLRVQKITLLTIREQQINEHHHIFEKPIKNISITTIDGFSQIWLENSKQFVYKLLALVYWLQMLV